MPSLLAASDVLGTGWFGAVAAGVQPGKTVAVVGDGAVGLLAVLAVQQLGAEQIIAFSRHEPRQEIARQFGATGIITERGDEGVARIKDLTNGLGAHCVIEAVGTQQSMMQAIRSTRPGGHVGYVGVSHDVSLPGQELFHSHTHLHGGPAPVRRFLPDLIDRIWSQQIDPGKVFDLTLPLDQVAEGYKAMDERRAIRRCWNPDLRIFTAMPRVARGTHKTTHGIRRSRVPGQRSSTRCSARSRSREPSITVLGAATGWRPGTPGSAWEAHRFHRAWPR